MMKKSLEIFAFLMVMAAARIFMVIPNFEPIGAMALFGGALVASKRLALLLPLAALFIGDLIYGLFLTSHMDYLFSTSFLMVYISFILIALIGRNLLRNNQSIGRIASSAVLASIVFFILTNFGSWLYDPIYAKNIVGLGQSYLAGLAFYKNDFFGNFFLNSVMGNVVFSLLAFGLYKLYAKTTATSAVEA
jgi:hypothetical protein